MLPNSYSLEALLWVLCCKFPGDTVVLVKPRMMVNMSAIYVNFMLVDGTGHPRPLEDLENQQDGDQPVVRPPKAVHHLSGLLHSLEAELGEALPDEIVLVGFSKGAAVLCALLTNAEEVDFWRRCLAMHFVDAGLARPGGFPVSAGHLKALASNVRENFTLWLHGTPRQLQDGSRPFVGEETDAFAQCCREAGLRVERRSYAEGLVPSLDMHFDSVRCFCTSAEDSDGGDRHCGFFSSWAATERNDEVR